MLRNYFEVINEIRILNFVAQATNSSKTKKKKAETHEKRVSEFHLT